MNASAQQGYENGVGSSYGNEQNTFAQGMGGLMEKFHGVSDRSTQPRKRIKIENGEENGRRKKVVFNGGVSGGGYLGNAMREEKEQGAKEAVKEMPLPTIDLTADDDDEPIVVKGVNHRSVQHGQNPKEYEEVCYGRCENTSISAHQVPMPTGRIITQGFWPLCKVTLFRVPGCSTIHCKDADGQTFGCIDATSSIGLNLVMDHVQQLRTSARILTRPRDDNLLPGSPCSQRLKLDLTLYGPRNRASDVGVILSQKQMWLRTPLLLERELVNPHAELLLTNPIQRPAHSSSSVCGFGYSAMRTVEEIRSDVLSVFDSLQQSEKLPLMDPDPRITTELLAHQKQGLYFMTNKEKERVYGDSDAANSSLWRLKFAANGTKSYYNVITGEEERQSPPQVLGGILADMMGLGKTLSILSLLVGSLENAREWAHMHFSESDGTNGHVDGSLMTKSKSNPPDPEEDLVRVKSTLLVCPLSTISNWEDQIKSHIKSGSITYYIYHGGNRVKDVQKLADFDLVVTTYGSVASEFGHRGKKGNGIYPLQSVKWFRIVLDEAHMIREQNTLQSRSICALHAQRRWAVTGTPVQNRLEDLGALLKFLRLKPFDEKNAFGQYILSPMKSADIEVVAKLRVLVDSVTLRRLKDKIDLPKRVDRVAKLVFNEDERRLYDIFAKNANDRVKVMAAGGGIKSFSHILHSITRLRLICAHGQSLLSDEDMKITEGLSKSSAIDLDSENEHDAPTLAAKEAYDIFNFMVETGADNCAVCAGKIGLRDEDSDGRDEITGYMISCMNVLCSNCFKDYNETTKAAAQSRQDTYCNLCDNTHRISYVALKQNQLEENEEARAEAKDSRGRKFKKVLSRYDGPHTKTKHLIQDLLKNKYESDLMPDEPPIKSVVFSTWTSHLNLIQMALEKNGITYTRLDGTMSRAKRGEAMEDFKENRGISVILVSISAGGMGLNLTAANKVYVMEPQFNPASEAQAVDRVHRLGQKREVETVRYIMQDSFEEKMQILQEKKLKLASLSMDAGKKGKCTNKLGLEELRDLFK